MKIKIVLIGLFGIAFGLNAQNVDLNNSTDYIRVQKNGESGFTRAFGLNGSNQLYIGSVEKTVGNIHFYNKGTGHLMTIMPSGNVGIGTTTPKEQLHLEGSFLLDSYSRGNETGIFFREGFNSTNKYNLSILTYDHSNMGASPDGFSFNAYDGISFSTGSNTRNERMRIGVNGNVGVGTTNPQRKLHISSKGASTADQPLRPEKWQVGIGHVDGTDQGEVLIGTYGKQPAIQGHGTGTSYKLLLNPYNGSVGVGTINPSGKLEVLKNADLSNAITLPNSGLVIRADNDGSDASLRFGVDNTNLKAVIQTQQTTTASKFDLLINPFGGNVGIGTKNSGSWKLAVNGKIRAKEIKVETGWSDFVFYDDYKLPTLMEVENHIKENGHLKDIPSEKDVKENGIFLGEMDAKLLQKIEELTLYTIQQQKEIQELKKHNSRIKQQEKEITKLKSLVESLLESKR